MVKATTPSFIMDVELEGLHTDTSIIETELEMNRVIYNTALGEYLKREKQMKRTKRYQKFVRVSRAIKAQLAKYQKEERNENVDYYQKEKMDLSEEFKKLREEYGLTEFSMHEYIKDVRHHFQDRVNSIIAQKTATRAWNTFRKKLFGKAKRVIFVKKGEMDSFEGKNNRTGWRFVGGKIISVNHSFSLIVKDSDVYLKEAFYYLKSQQAFQYRDKDGEVQTDFYKVKYVRILKRTIRGRQRYFAQLVCAGYPPVKRDSQTGAFKYPLGQGCVGIDIGTSSLAVSSSNKVMLKNLAENIKKVEPYERQIKMLKRKLDRSKRATNPLNYDEKGRIKKGEKRWYFSKNYVKDKNKLNAMYRKMALYRKFSHQYEANRMVSLGETFFVEDMNFNALQKRSKKTEISEKTGKYKKKKRFGKSIVHRSPATFVSILSKKVLSAGGVFIKVKTASFKASQYDHKTDTCKKKKLKDRWHLFQDGIKVQRDLYSAFLLMNSDSSGLKPVRASCLMTFPKFYDLHVKELSKIESDEIVILNSGIRLKQKKAAQSIA